MDDKDKKIIAEHLYKILEPHTEIILENHIKFRGVFLYLKESYEMNVKFVDLELEVVKNDKFQTLFSIFLKKDIALDVFNLISDKIKDEFCVGVYTDYSLWEKVTSEIKES